LKTVKKSFQETFREKGSKFIGILFSANSKEEFETQLKEIVSEFPDATHHCYAWRINPNKIEEFTQDDGEPSGTAGLPILNELKSFEIVNCGCVVVRYYGGTKLGKSGLIQAYGHTAKLCLQKGSLHTLIPTQNFVITYPYSQQAHVNQLKNQFDLKEVDAQYAEQVTLEIACRSEQADEFSDSLKRLSHQEIKFEKKGEGFVTIQQ
jgi:uncharacterized YigZ family protein